MNRENVSRSFTDAQKKSIVVQKLPQTIDEAALTAVFTTYGEIISVKIKPSSGSEGEAKLKGYVCFTYYII